MAFPMVLSMQIGSVVLQMLGGYGQQGGDPAALQRLLNQAALQQQQQQQRMQGMVSYASRVLLIVVETVQIPLLRCLCSLCMYNSSCTGPCSCTTEPNIQCCDRVQVAAQYTKIFCVVARVQK